MPYTLPCRPAVRRAAFIAFAALFALYPGWWHGFNRSWAPLAVNCWGTTFVVLCAAAARLLTRVWSLLTVPEEGPLSGDDDIPLVQEESDSPAPQIAD